MIFSSTLFLFFFFPVYFVVFYVLKKNIRIQNVWIILGSVLFYAYGAREFFLIVLGTLLIDYCLGLLIYKHKRFAKLFTALDVIINIGILAYFKYLNFFIDNINLIFAQLGWNPILFTRIALPLGVSFVVFQKMTYCLDIAKGISQPTNNFFYLLEYLLIFPQIVAGPIVKYNEISDQIQQRNITRDSFSNGFNRFAIGLFKKVWIADVVARIADSVFEAHALGGVPLDYAWLGIIDTVDKSVVLWYNEEKRTGVFLHGEQLSTARYVRCDVGNSQAVHNRKQGNVGRERKGYPSISEWRVLDFENGSTMERPAAGIW